MRAIWAWKRLGFILQTLKDVREEGVREERTSNQIFKNILVTKIILKNNWKDKEKLFLFWRIIVAVENDIFWKVIVAVENDIFWKIIVAVSQMTYYTEICGGY